MIENFRDRRLKRLYDRGDASLLPPDMFARVQTIIGRLDVAETIEDLKIHSYRLHPLRGNRKGYWSITVRANWRIIFRFREGHVYDVELIDYH